MPDTAPTQRNHGMFGFLRVPLFRLLAINLAAGTALAALLVGGLLALNPAGLRDLILADSSPGTALALLLFGFVVTFGSAAMGTAIMAMGRREPDDGAPRGPPLLVKQRAALPARATGPYPPLSIAPPRSPARCGTGWPACRDAARRAAPARSSRRS
jgi:hypothetical protein